MPGQTSTLLPLSDALRTSPATRCSVSSSHQIDFRSAITGRDYRLMVHVPEAPPPPGGHPLLLLADGNLYFAGAVDSVRLQGLHFITPPVVVGIGYPSDDIHHQLTARMRDLTPWISAQKRSQLIYLLGSGGRALEDHEIGGLDLYLDMLEKEIKPFVSTLAPVDHNRQVLFGHSLGGRTALHALFTRTGSYSGYVASAPSIWWDDSSVLQEEHRFGEASSRSAAPPRIMLAVGGLEEELPRTLAPLPVSEDVMLAQLRAVRMVGNLVDLGARLGTLPGYGPDNLLSVVFPEEDHVSVVPAAISRALRFMFGRDT
jgi:uncharacterized protein